jgi:hypothetical protein
MATKLSAVARVAIKRALSARKLTVAKLRVRAVDSAGNAATLTRQVRLKR